MTVLRNVDLASQRNHTGVYRHGAVAGHGAGGSDAAAVAVRGMVGGGMHFAHVADSALHISCLHDTRRAFLLDAFMAEDSLHHFAVGNDFFHFHAALAGLSFLHHHFLVSGKLLIVPFLVIDGEALRAGHLTHGVRHHMDLHALLHLHHAVFDGHHLFPVISGVIHHALHSLLGGVDHFRAAIGNQDHRHSSLDHHDGAVIDSLRAGPEPIMDTHGNLQFIQNPFVTVCLRRNNLLLLAIIDRYLLQGNRIARMHGSRSQISEAA